jgi:N-acetyl-alpha-D-muramate 1-phosphate uridylyltransferase
MSLPAIAILAGGLATRLKEVTKDRPKSLVEVVGKPFLHHQLKLLRQRGIEDVVLCVGHLGQQIEAFAGDGRAWGLKIRYSFDGEKLLGTGGALKKARGLLSDPFFVMYGDSYLEADPRAVKAAYDRSGLPGLMTVYQNDGRFDRSNVWFENNRIAAYRKGLEDPRMRHIDYGLGLLSQAALDLLPREEFDLAALYSLLVEEGRLAGFEIKERFYEIGSEQGIRDLDQHLRGQ